MAELHVITPCLSRFSVSLPFIDSLFAMGFFWISVSLFFFFLKIPNSCLDWFGGCAVVPGGWILSFFECYRFVGIIRKM